MINMNTYLYITRCKSEKKENLSVNKSTKMKAVI